MPDRVLCRTAALTKFRADAVLLGLYAGSPARRWQDLDIVDVWRHTSEGWRRSVASAQEQLEDAEICFCIGGRVRYGNSH